MYELAIMRGDKVFTRHAIGDKPLTIGRAPDNAVRLTEAEISRHHCRIEIRNGKLLLVDNSTNGTLVNGEFKKDAVIKTGDKLTIGQWTAAIEKMENAVSVRTTSETPCHTKLVEFDPSSKKLITEKIKITVNSPDQAPLSCNLHANELTFGHHASCNVVIADPFVSRHHCKIVHNDDHLELIDLNSTNGTFVGGIKVNQTRLGSQGMFCVGKSIITYRIVRADEKISPLKVNKFGKMIGKSKQMREIFALIERIAPTDATVCIFGESGVGKELVARELHDLSPRRRKNFVAVNCGALPPSIIESQLFGHERGAFTGAVERSIGFFEQANGGTLFLDEIGELPLDLQTRLLRVLESKSIKRIGSQEDIPINLRLVCATNKNLKEQVKKGQFREDLFFRIHIIPIEIPPLKSRKADIYPLAEYFMDQAAKPDYKPHLTEEAKEKLTNCNWPGNIRELKNTIERTLLLSGKDIIDANDLMIDEIEISQSDNLTLKDKERKTLLDAIKENNWNLTFTANALKIARTTLQKKIKRLEIELPKSNKRT